MYFNITEYRYSRKEIHRINEKNSVGVIGSPTLVWRAFRPEFSKDTKEIKEDYVKNILEIIQKVH